jgi:hypothetical protein
MRLNEAAIGETRIQNQKQKLNRTADLAQASGRDGSPRARNIIQH